MVAGVSIFKPLALEVMCCRTRGFGFVDALDSQASFKKCVSDFGKNRKCHGYHPEDTILKPELTIA